MMIPVEKTFEAFVLQFGGELVSTLISSKNPPKNADYLFRSPLIIAELKCAERESFTEQDQHRLKSLAHDWMQRGLIPPIFGRGRINLRSLPPQCQRDWLDLLKAPWKRKLEDANKQIKQTKSLLNLADACGILFLVDNAAHSFPPGDTMGFISRVLQSRKTDQTAIYSHLDWVVYFSVNPRTVSHDGIGMNFWMPGYRHRPPDLVISEFLDKFKREWIRYLGDVLGTKTFELSAAEYPPMGNWAEGLHGLRTQN